MSRAPAPPRCECCQRPTVLRLVETKATGMRYLCVACINENRSKIVKVIAPTATEEKKAHA